MRYQDYTPRRDTHYDILQALGRQVTAFIDGTVGGIKSSVLR